MTRPTSDARPAAAVALAALVSACAEGRSEMAADSALPAGSYSTAGARLVHQVIDFHGPESVRYDPEQDVFFVSNMYGYGSAKDGNGFIARIEAGDPSRVDIFIQGGRNGVTLDAPKGMALHGDTLWVTDIDVLRGFDRRTGAPLATVDLRPHRAVLLNDVAVGPDGALHVTDSGIIMSDKGVIHAGGDKILVVGPGRAVSVLAEGGALRQPNGIAWDARGRRWVVASFDPFKAELYTPRPGDTTRTVLAVQKGKLDGVEVLADGRVLVTCWNDSSLHLLTLGGERPGDEQVVRNLPTPADLGVDTRRNRVAIPLTIADRVEIWELPGKRGS